MNMYIRVPELLACTQGYLNYWPVPKGTWTIGLYRKIPELWTVHKGTWIIGLYPRVPDYSSVHMDTWINGLYTRAPELLDCTER